ncbi:MAG: hypothetical protein HQK49_07265 [Oligoflexia bacterium]|nr:hypothetical protein [Oligoflexia bacterium]
MPVTWIEYKQINILYVDYKNTTDKEKLQMLQQQADILAKHKEFSVLILVDVCDCNLSKEFMVEAKNISKQYIAPKTKRAAIIGVTGFRKLMLTGLNLFIKRNIVPFYDETSAKEFLFIEGKK